MKGWQTGGLTILATFLVVLLAGCGGGTEEARDLPQSESTPETASTDSDRLPDDHPPIGEPSTSAIQPPPAGSGTGSTAVQWTAPEGWVEQTPSSSMRKAQYAVPGPGGEGELAVFYFGPGQGGDPMANARRWASQFSQPEGSPATDAMQTNQLEVHGVPVLMIETKGTYTNRMVSAEEFPGYMLLAAIVEGPDANWFFKLTGPEATVEDQRDEFADLINSVQTGN